MKLSDYLNQLERGGKAAFARAIGAYPSDLTDWSNGERAIPVRFAPAIERESGGAIRCEELHPDVDWSYLRATTPQTTQTQEA